MTRPTLSVILSNYNHAQFVTQALDSALSQSFRDVEFLIVDDASTDDSVAVIERAIKGDSRVNFVRNDVNKGLMANTAMLLREARGELLHWYAADDYVEPNFYRDHVEILRKHPEAAFSVGSYQRLYQATGRFEPVKLRWSDRPCFLSPTEYAAAVERHGGVSIGLSALVRRDLMDAAGGIRADLRWYSDWFLLLTLALRHGVCFLPEVYGTWRRLPTAYHAAGTANRVQQHEIIGRVLDLFHEPDFADLLPLFEKTGAFGDMGPYIVSAFLTNPARWNVDNARLMAGGVRARVRTRIDRLLHGERATRL